MNKLKPQYLVSFQSEPFHRYVRHHWTICEAQKPEELVSWGHAPTRELAETAAEKEVEDLTSGATIGGRALACAKSVTYRFR
jgi:hypothetical protein